MKVRVQVDQEVEVEISARDAAEALLDLPDSDSTTLACMRINNCYAYLKHIPATIIATMNDKQLAAIQRGLQEQADRYKPRGKGPRSDS